MGYFAKTAFACGIPMQGFAQLRFIKIKPKCVGKVQLGISGLPQQKVADALLATCADDQVNLGMPAVLRRCASWSCVSWLALSVGLPVFNSLHHIPLASIVGSHTQNDGHVLWQPGRDLFWHELFIYEIDSGTLPPLYSKPSP